MSEKGPNLAGVRIVVTGGAGFIGSELIRQAIAAGASVVAVDNLRNGKRENLDGLPAPSFRLEVADIRDLSSMDVLFAKADIVLHLACLGVRHSIHSPLENHEVNATGTLNLLAIAHRRKLARFIYVSSSEVYGTAKVAPMSEEHPTQPTTVYGASKLAGERYTGAYFVTYGLPTIVLRPFNAFGPRSHHEGDSGEVIPKFLLRAMAGRSLLVHGDGTQTRDFTFVSDTARGILLAATAPIAIGQTINLGQGKEISINDLAAAIAGVLGRKNLEVRHGPPRPGDVLRLCADTSHARALLGFEPRTSLRQGLEQLQAWYLSHDRNIDSLLDDEIDQNWQGSAA